jgi:hypothetical protein
VPVDWTQQGENGLFEAVLDTEDGAQPQRFRGDSYKAVADKLADAQVHASRRIRELRQAIPVDKQKPAAPVQQQLTPDQRFQIARDITDPAKSDQAIAALLRAQGIPVEEVRGIINAQREQQEHDEALEESQAFVAMTPDWNPSEHNKSMLVNYMKNNNMAPTRHNLSLAFEALREAGLVQPKPEETSNTNEPETYPEPIARATTRPRSTVSTGLRSAQGRTTPPAPPRSKYTKQAIRNMSTNVYRDKLLHEPGFAAAVDAAL